MPVACKYFYVLDFTVKNQSGLAIVLASNETEAANMLKAGGRYNSTPQSYAINRAMNVGKYNGSAHGLMLESYTNALVAFDAIAALLAQSEVVGPYAYDAIPPADGAGSAGSVGFYSRGDHQHPSDPTKQDVIEDLGTIRSNASSAYQLPQNGIPRGDLSQDVQDALVLSDESIRFVPTTDPLDEEYIDEYQRVLAALYQALADAQNEKVDYIGADYYVYRWNAGLQAYEKTDIYVKGDYTKPSSGIPLTDLESTVRNALSLAQTAVQPADLEPKADKIDNAVNNNLVAMDSTGNIKDSGKKASDFATATQGAKADTAYQMPVGGVPKSDLASGVQTSLDKADTALQSHQDLTPITSLIPGTASSSNQLADKNFVNSSIATNTGSYITDDGRPFVSLYDLQHFSGTVNNNDYAFVVGTDEDGNTIYTRYKYNASISQWAEEYVLNNSSFTYSQWETIQSGLSSADKTKIDTIAAGAQVNVIETVKVNGTALAVDGKAVNVIVPDDYIVFVPNSDPGSIVS